MRMPGFTAEASLYKTSEPYYMTGILEQARGDVQAAQFPIPEPPFPRPIPFPPRPRCVRLCFPECRRICIPGRGCFPLCRRVCQIVCF